MLLRLLEINPWIEVAVKKLYWHSSFLNSTLSVLLKKIRRTAPATIEINPMLSGQIVTTLQEWGVKHGDILIVHSSMGNLKKLGLNASQLIEVLRSLVGPNGTLAMPSIPLLVEEPKGTERLSDAICTVPVKYNVQETIPWTGVLPLTLMKLQDAVRSNHPLNTLVAVGPDASAMMKDNLEGEKPLACGLHSSWKYCADKNAKIVSLGTDLAHSLTMIHLAEDAYEKDWPIEGWYRDRLFDVTDKGVTRRITLRERHPKWAIYYAERTLAKDLKRDGVMKSVDMDGVLVEFLESRNLLAYLNARKSKAYPYFILGHRKKH